MIKRRLNLMASLAITMMLLSGCLFANVVGTPENLTTQPVVQGAGAQTGVAKCSIMFIGLLAWGDCSVEKAMDNGNITELHHVSQKLIGVPLIYAKAHTVVKGE